MKDKIKSTEAAIREKNLNIALKEREKNITKSMTINGTGFPF